MKVLLGMLIATAAFAQTDRDALNRLHDGNRQEIEMGGLASARAASPEVKRYAKMLIDDHGAMDKDLVAFARRHGITLDTKAGDSKDLIALRDMQGADFDRRFGELARSDHEKDIKEARSAAEKLKGTPTGDFIAQVVPKLEKHLRHAQGLGVKRAAE